MTLLSVAGLSFGYGAERLFGGVTFTVAPGERVALVAPNGVGKTTLLRLLSGELAPDEGTVVVRRGARIAVCRQSHELRADGTVLDAFLSGFAAVLALRHELSEAQHSARSGGDEALERLSLASDAYHIAGGDDLERRVEIIASHLGFSTADMDRPLASLSGGERGRLHLGVVLAQDADLLLLDEPTNHLDIDTIDWLERHLAAQRSAMLVVSHDRAFLDAVCPITAELGRRSFRSYPLRYSDYVVARQADLERERELADRHVAFVAKTEDFIRRNIAGQKTKQAQSRRKMLEKLETVDRPEDVWAVAERVRFCFAPAPRTGDVVLECTGLCAERGGRRLFEGLDLLVKRGDRIGIVGANGTGKSTLLRLLAGRGDPADRGSVRRGTNLCEGYFDQHLGSLDPARTAVEEIRSVRGDLNADGAREYLARFRFWGDDPLRRVGGFSGGERSRLALAKLLLEPKNLLLLDEPTNHLDIPAAEILEEALSTFQGTALIVSHDRRFLERTTTRILAMREGTCDVYPGDYAEWRRAHDARRTEVDAGRRRDAPREAPTRAPTVEGKRKVLRSARTVPQVEQAEPPEERRRAFEADKARQRAAERKRRRAQELERDIARAEADLGRMRDELKGDPCGDWERLAKLAAEEQALAARVDRAMTEWISLTEELRDA